MMSVPSTDSGRLATALDPAPSADALPWVHVAPHAPYFVTEDGDPWTPIGHNDALSWPPLSSILDTPEQSEAYFGMLLAHGVTCVRLMLEYAHKDHHLLERPVGRFRPRMVARWDRIFGLAERHGIRLLLTPFDTFWMWKRWARHSHNPANGGPCAREQLLTSSAARDAIKARFAFAIDRWGGSGALFAWDIWNEIHPAYGGNDVGVFDGFISDIAAFVRERELARYGRAHPITVSAFGPMLQGTFGSRELGRTVADPRAADAIFRHEALDFATVHTYAHGTIDDPANTVDAAIAMGALTRTSLAEIRDGRPFFDSEHGPIHRFKDRRRVLAAAFDEEYFRHIQWAHLASGAAGGGMRWPNRRPHSLTPGMHAAQRALYAFLPLVEWREFNRRNLNEEIRITPGTFARFGCGDERQAVVWVVRRKPLARNGMLHPDQRPDLVTIHVPGLATGSYIVTAFDTEAGVAGERLQAASFDGHLRFDVPIARDRAFAIRRPSSSE
jgi:mannan endo-1,4-beta-mannosidase